MAPMSRPRLLDLFCGAGGAGMGYHQAGFEVVGVDIDPQPDYPFEFRQADAVTHSLDGFDAIHASPPCQAFSAMGAMWNAKGDHPELVDVMRARLVESGLPYVIENVPGAPMVNPVVLCGSSMGLGAAGFELRRHRLFETNFPVMVPPCAHQRATIGIYGDHARNRSRINGSKDRGQDFPDTDKLELGREAMGMPWVTRWHGLSQAIPPAYTEHLGSYLMAAVQQEAAAA